VAFITRQGFITQASPPKTWAAAGTKQVALTNIPLGPSNVVARLILFTPVITAPATTGSFYSLPNGTTQLATPTTMVINDNTTTAATLDFSDTILQAGFSANYLFTQLELGESAFVTGYNSRLCWLGERNHIPNMINLGFDGGFSGGGGAANAGPNSPTAASTTRSRGELAWTNPNNVFAADGVLATASLFNLGPDAIQTSGLLKATGYGFAIPSNATIVGIKVQALVKGRRWINHRQSVKLLKGGVEVGTNHAQRQIAGRRCWPTRLTAHLLTFGEQRGRRLRSTRPLSEWKYSAASMTAGDYPRTASIDYISIQVYYTTPAAGGPSGWTQGAAFAGGASATSGGFSGRLGGSLCHHRRRGDREARRDQPVRLPGLFAGSHHRPQYRLQRKSAGCEIGTLTQGTLHINLVSVTGAFTTAGLSVQASDLTARIRNSTPS
jgi:hypothetical protein